MSWRPDTIAEIARRGAARKDRFDLAVREFIDTWQGLVDGERAAALAEEPIPVGKIEDAYLGALAEHLAAIARIEAPPWAEAPCRFLREPYFAGGLESLRAILLVESPPAFRRRLLYISANALSRPRRDVA